MPTQRYSVTPHPIETILTWVKSREIAIPEIQRPFVWEATKVRNLLDSLYRGYPVGYLIAWRNPTVKLKDGTLSAGKRILIDGQQRVTALMAAFLGQEVLTKDYESVRIRIAFNPLTEKFEVANPAIRKNSEWIPDVSVMFAPDADLMELTEDYVRANPGTERKSVWQAIQGVSKTTNNHLGLIELAEDLDIETVTEIFIRVNSAGAELSQADFAMSKIAANENHGGNEIRKAIDYFCHLSVAPEFLSTIEKKDAAFTRSDFFPKMRWLADANDDIYDPSYTDMLRVAFMSQFGRAKLQDLVALLSGRNFETKQYEDAIAETSFASLRVGIHQFVNQTHFERFTMILRSAGFVIRDMIGSQNAVNFAYTVYLLGREEKVPPADLERVVRQWYALTILSGRSSGSFETRFDQDMRQIATQGLREYTATLMAAELPDSFWTGSLPQSMDTSAARSPYFLAFKAAQVKAHDKGFLSRDISTVDLLLNRVDVHHVYPKQHLKRNGLARGQYNQIANFVLAQSEINIQIGDRPPEDYFVDLGRQCAGGAKKYGGITSREEMELNLKQHCLPSSLLDGVIPDYEDFLVERRRLMALKIRSWFESL
jgi:hypothetical protein